MNARKLTLALGAGESAKADLLLLLKSHLDEIAQLTLVSTGETAAFIHHEAALLVESVMDGSCGGVVQICALVAQKEITAVIFLRDVLLDRPENPEILTLFRLCNIVDVPLATNISTAEAVLHLLFEHPEALTGHHLAAQLLEDQSHVHQP